MLLARHRCLLQLLLPSLLLAGEAHAETAAALAPEPVVVGAPGPIVTAPPTPEPMLAPTPEPASAPAPDPVQAAAPGPAAAPALVPNAVLTPTTVATPSPVVVAAQPQGAHDSVLVVNEDAERRPLRRDVRGTYFQLRAMGLFGLNSTHEFAKTCPTYDCSVQMPLGLGVGFTLGWEKKGWGIELLGLLLFDHTQASYHHAVQRTVYVPSASAAASGSADANGGGGLDVKIGKDGIKIGGDLFGDLTGDSKDSGSAPLEAKTVVENQREDVSVTRLGGAVGVGVRRNFGRRPARLSLALSGGVLHRGISPTNEAAHGNSYTAPFALADIGFVFGKRGGFQLSLVGMAEFPHSVWLEDFPGVARIRVTGGAQYYLGPMLGIQWGPRSPPREGRVRQRYGREPEVIEYEE